MGCRIDDFSYWLPHEVGHALTLHTLQGDDGETFAERFAQKLLFPESVAAKALEAIRAANDRMAAASWFAGSFDVSIVAAVKAADRIAKERGEAPTGLDTGPFYGAWKRNRKNFPTAAHQLFGTDAPAPLEYIVKSEQLCGTPVFRALARVPAARGPLAGIRRRHAERQHGRRVGAISGARRVVGLTVRRRLAEQR